MDILEKLKQKLPSNADVSDVCFEGSELVVYIKNKDMFVENGHFVKDLAKEFKKRIDLRPATSIRKDMEEAKENIKKVVPDEAEIREITFEPGFGRVIIEAVKPGLVIGKGGRTLEKIKKNTYWSPVVKRASVIKSDVVDTVRRVLYEESEFRKDFLDDIGKRIHGEEKKDVDWLRLSFLGGFREVGRSCLLLQTPESNVMLDCGIKPGGGFPYLQAPEVDIQNLDAVILSHPHLDHCLSPTSMVTLADGRRKPIKEISLGDKLKSMNWNSGEIVDSKCVAKKEVEETEIFEVNTPYHTIEASPDHRFFTVNGLEVREVKAKNLEEGMLIPSKSMKRDGREFELKQPSYEERVEINSDLINRFKELRESENLSQKQFSEEMGLGENFGWRLENKKKMIELSNLEKIINYFNLDESGIFEKFDLSRTKFPRKLNSQVAQILGYLFGDGHQSEGWSVIFTDKNTGCLERYQNLIRETFNVSSKIERHSDSTKNAWVLKVNNAGIVRFFEDNFDNIFGDEKTKIPQKVMEADEQIVTSFLRGLADAEGDVSEVRIGISSAVSSVRKDIQYLLSNLKIPATIVSDDRRVAISSKGGMQEYFEKVGFTHPKKMEKLKDMVGRINNEEYSKQELLPICSNDLDKILTEAGLIGRVNKSFSVKNLPTAILDWHRRGDNSYATRETCGKLVNVLESRMEKLERIKSEGVENLLHKRRSISYTQENLSSDVGLSRMQLQYRENNRLVDRYSQEMLTTLNSKIETAISKTSKNIQKLKNLISMDVKWERIRKIDNKENPYPYLVDIQVETSGNFIASDVVVHNCGFIPYLYEYGYEGPLYCTPPTRDLMVLLDLDYIDIAKREGDTVPYSSKSVEKAVKHSVCLEYNEVSDITPDMRLTFHNAGHLLGSALSHIHVGQGFHNIVYSGDHNYGESRLFDPAFTNFRRIETLITESTYGAENGKQPRRADAERKLIKTAKKTLERGGKVLIPSFAVGRAQEVMCILSDQKEFDYPVYLEGMLWDATAIHTTYPEYLNKKLQNKILHKGENPFVNEIFKRVGSKEERDELLRSPKPCIILTTSGMLTGGPVMEYLKKLAENEKNTLIFVGYQAEGTMGRRIQNGWDEIPISTDNGKRIGLKMNMEVKTVEGLSGHSDRNQLSNFVRNLNSKPGRIICNHGDNSSCINLCKSLHKKYNIETVPPKNLEVMRLD